jgi:hypothetical protein
MINGTLAPSDIPPSADFAGFLKVCNVLLDPARASAMGLYLEQTIKISREETEAAKKAVAELDTKRNQHEENLRARRAVQESQLASDRRAFKDECSTRSAKSTGAKAK